MSALGAALSKAVGSVGGPQVTALIVVGGLVVGGVAGGFIASGGGQQATAAAELPIYPCPDVGPAIAKAASGQTMLATGRTADSAYVRIHFPLPGRTEAWVQAAPLKLEGALADLPVATCAPEVAAPIVLQPGQTYTALQNNSPSPTPTPQPTTPNAGPTLTKLSVQPATLAGGPQRYCPDTARSVRISVTATDPDTIAGVALFYRKIGASDYVSKPMAQTGGTGPWQATLGTDADGITGPGSLRFYVSATDANPVPRTTRLPGSGTRSISVEGCSNTGPTLTSLTASPSTVVTNPGACRTSPTTTTISVTAADVDGVAGLTLFYKLPGDGSYRTQPMTASGSKYSAPVTPLDQRANADGKTSYYVVAKDKLGKTSKSAMKTFTVDRCDTEATFFVNALRTSAPYIFCPPKTTSVNLVWDFSITDPDGLTTATLSYKVVNPRTGANYSGSRTVEVTSQRFSISSAALDGNDFYGSNSVTWTITTTDQYGGTSAASGKGTVTISVC